MGLTWREAVSLLPGIVAKEGIVASLGVVYGVTGDELGKAMRRAGITARGAFALMVVTLLFVPCLPTVGAIFRETGSWCWTGVAIVYPAVLAWVAGMFVAVVGGILGG